MEVSSHKLRTNNDTGSPLFSTPFSAVGSWSSQQQHTGSMGAGGVNSQENWRQKVGHLKKFFGDEFSPRPSQIPSGFQYGQQILSTQNVQNYQQSYKAMLNNAFQKSSIRERCDEISKILPQMSVMELRDVYPRMLHYIFGYESNSGWGLHYLEPRMHSYDFNAMENFLSPSGCVFNAICRLLSENDALFQLPFDALPSGIKEAISKNQIPSWYQSRIIANPGRPAIISMNALEYYFAMFAYFVAHPKTLQLQSDWSGIEDVLYVRLFEMYLSEYLPYDGSKFQAISPNSSPAPSSRPHHQSALLKSSLWRSPDIHFSNQRNVNLPSFHLDQLQHLPSKTETFLQIVTDFWLAFNSEEFIQQEEVYKLPSIDHARMVRILIKYLHTFNNATKKNVVQTFGDTPTQLDMDDYQNVLIPVILHNKLYGYLNHCFNHWPLDGTFRMVLETWLSFLQPWRYQNVNTSMDESTTDVTKWKKFISSNLHFYSNLFSTFLLRALKHDLMSIEDVQLVYRVFKVISQNSLKEILQEKMEEVPHDFNKTAFQTTFNSPHSIHNRMHPESSIISGNQSLFSPDTISHAQELCQALSSTLIGVRRKILVAVENKKKKPSSSWLAYLKEVFMVDDDVNYDHKRNEQRLIEYLDQSCKMLSEFFKFPELPTEPSRVGDDVEPVETVPGMVRPHLQQFHDEDTLPEHMMDEDGIKLTDRGRYQIIQGLRKFQFVYSGDPELQPIRSYECPGAVRLLYRISSNLNLKYSNTLEEFYNRQDFVGSMLRRMSSKGLQNEHFAGSSIKLTDSLRKTIVPATGALPTNSEMVKPRITLRFASSYYFMGYICWGIVLARLFGFSWMFIVLLTILIVLFSIIFHIDSPPKRFKND